MGYSRSSLLSAIRRPAGYTLCTDRKLGGTAVAIQNTISFSEQPGGHLHPTDAQQPWRKVEIGTKMPTKTTSLNDVRQCAAEFAVSVGVAVSSNAKGPHFAGGRSSQATVLNGNVHPLARPQYDQGRVEAFHANAGDLGVQNVRAQQADLDALLASQQDRGSPDYQRWLTPEQYGSRFGLSQSDINKVTGWLESEGLQVESIPASQNAIVARGSAQQVAAALHTEMHRYLVNGNAQFANSSSPSVPASLADVISGIRGLHNFALKPRLVRQISPKFTSGVTGNHFVTPPDFATIYRLNSLYQQGINGTGQKIVVVGQSDVALGDVRAFRTNSGLAANDPTPIDANNSALVGLIVPPGASDPGMQSSDIDEANLDVEWQRGDRAKRHDHLRRGQSCEWRRRLRCPAICDNAQPDSRAGDQHKLRRMRSQRHCGWELLGFYLPLMQQANAEGITVLASSGDSGAADCDIGNSSVNGLAVDMPGSLPTVTSVGGTEFQEGADAIGQFWNRPACIGPGCADVVSSARSYIPEGAWNDTNVVINGSSIGLTAGGGGASSVIAKPAWRAGTGVPNDAARDVPDVSFSASPLQDPYLICSEYVDPTSNQLTPWCTTNGFRNASTNITSTGNWTRWGDIGWTAGDGGDCGADQPVHGSLANERFGQHQCGPLSSRGAYTHSVPRRHHRE